jgi:hypothetical protein
MLLHFNNFQCLHGSRTLDLDACSDTQGGQVDKGTSLEPEPRTKETGVELGDKSVG